MDPRSSDNEPRALPAAVYVPEHTIKMIVGYVAELLPERREKRKIVLLKSGRYRASTDQVVLYQHDSKLPPPKGDLLEVKLSKIRDIPPEIRVQMWAPKDDEGFLSFVRKYWDESFEFDSPVTLLICHNLRGELVDSFVERHLFHKTLPQSSQE